MEELSLDMVELGHVLLERDILYDKISSRERSELVDFAIEIGENTGKEILKRGINKDNPCEYIENYCAVNFIHLKPSLPIYSETLLQDAIINIYCSEIDNLYLCLKEDGLMVDSKRLYNIFILHEFFHVLEGKELGCISEMKKIRIFKLFFWEIKRGIPQLSEIAANAFLRTIIDDLPIWYISKEGL